LIDFQNGSLLKLSQIDPADVDSRVRDFIGSNGKVLFAAKGVRDSVIFTDRHIIAFNVQGMTGKKADCTFLPYSKIAAFSVETAGTFDIDSEVELFVSGVGRVRFEFTRGTDTVAIGRILSHYV